jgi:tRNA-dihydrouridine synthase B
MTRGLNIAGVKISRPLVLAPMAGVSDGPFRRICREMGAGLTCTEMISADGLVRGNRRTLEYLRVSDEERPVSLQLFGHDPGVLAKAAAIAWDRCRPDFIDLNCGCPVRKVVSRKAGAALLLDLPLLRRIVEAMAGASPAPVTVKIRSGWSAGDSLAVEASLAAQEAGACAVTIHARPRSAAFSAEPDWVLIRLLKESLTVPVIGNGGVGRPADARAMLEETGCDAVMIGRAAMGNPWIFRGASALLDGAGEAPVPGAGERLAVFLRHAEELAALKGEARGVRQMRKQAAWYSKGLAGSSEFRRRVNSCTTVEGLVLAVEAALGGGTGCELRRRGAASDAALSFVSERASSAAARVVPGGRGSSRALGGDR